MHELMNWDFDEQFPRSHNDAPPLDTPSPILVQPPISLPINSRGIGAPIKFWDVTSSQWREGKITRIAQSREHQNEYLGHLPVVTLYLIEYASEKNDHDLTVICEKLIFVPKKPRV